MFFRIGYTLFRYIMIIAILTIDALNDHLVATWVVYKLSTASNYRHKIFQEKFHVNSVTACAGSVQPVQ